MEARSGIGSAEAKIAKIDRELARLLTAIKAGGPIEAVVEDMKRLEQRKNELKSFLAEADEPPPMLHPSMALQYRKRVQQLYEALQGDDEARRVEAADTLRTLVDQIILTPAGDRLEIDVQGDLAGILAISAQSKNPAALATGAQVKMVAGAGFEPAAFRL